jgi:hypothetical protein
VTVCLCVSFFNNSGPGCNCSFVPVIVIPVILIPVAIELLLSLSFPFLLLPYCCPYSTVPLDHISAKMTKKYSCYLWYDCGICYSLGNPAGISACDVA